MNGQTKETPQNEPLIFRSRTVAWVAGVEGEEGNKIVRAVVPGWDLDQVMEFPLSLVPEELRGKIQPEATILVKVNLAAGSVKDLNPDEFELAPPPIDESEL